MIVDARYTSGAGVLLGSGAHWVLLTDPADEQVVQEIWDVLSMAATSGPTAVEQVLAIVEKAFDGDPPGLAMVDFTSGASTSLSRGAGHVRLAGPGRVLSRDQIMDALKGHPLEAFDRSIDVHISRIRSVIEDDAKNPKRVLTVRGSGYLFARKQDA